MKSMKKRIFYVLGITALLLLCSSVVDAAKYTLPVRTSGAGWKTKKKTEKTVYVIGNVTKYVTTTEYQEGRTYNTDVKRISNKYKLKKGESLSHSRVESSITTHTFSISATAEVLNFGVSIGYSREKTRETSDTIIHGTGNVKTAGTYWYGVYANVVDVSIYTKKTKYDYINKKWVYDKIVSSSRKSGTQFTSDYPFTYAWYRD